MIAGESAKITAWQDGVRRAAATAAGHIATRLTADRQQARAALDARLNAGLEAARSTAIAVERRHGPAHSETRSALAEAAARRAAAEVAVLPPEDGGPRGPEPTRYGDWEKKGLAIDF
jgi:hypothetical protein